MKRISRPWLKALSALSSNISAAWFIASFIGPNVAFPKKIEELIPLTLHVAFGILFLLLTVQFEKELAK